ncbi:MULTISPECIES: AMP-binding protein [Mycobacteroides]|uniref:AMP-dependent synthetase n=1 Tax=Mycobacteroides chelonae TaxID=1774 RepID=A0A1S1LRC9_MYCCH|nr:MULTISPECIES: AMP-binding protein [Mycobacteroides]KRQ19162.1 AMP-dependent synthetase [Mycobacteroides sp. H003]KRQ32873.1 AMP-dependent synthetase [Mycobacteroides sp. H092]KRQ43342.1 AMP-dependent synthetase [Mycobacteroides sp. H063]KRQ44694.1 AMP-dependent synthetase [Mycobacteroides sp. H101]KRQ57973.1 AMP-dependent synthetase [Mycobacteroides sp. HXVII]
MTDIAISRHAKANAPALASGAIDYAALLRSELEQIDFYDSRRHLYTLAAVDLVHATRTRAAALAARGLRRGDRVAMIAASDEEYLTTLLAVLLLGAVPCAIAPPPTPSRPESAGVAHLVAALGVLNPAMVITQPRIEVAITHPLVVMYDELTDAEPIDWQRCSHADPGDIHHIQLTSGSTSAPKAVLLTHGNVVHNATAIAYGTKALRGRDRVFSWLPFYHDMGFIQVLAALLYGLRIGVMTPMGFLRDPVSWLRHMSQHGSTHTAGPPFAYRAVAEAISRGGSIADVDLSSLRHAYVGAEPIAFSVLREVTERFAPLGMRTDVLVPCYGMAETVLATTVALQAGMSDAPSFGRVRVGRGPDDGEPVVSCGKVVDGLELRIVTPVGARSSDGTVGDIQVRGPSVMAGYLTADGGVATPVGGWHDTGDRGFLTDGELFVVGRHKEMLIVRGRNFPPYDIEREIDSMSGAGGVSVVFSLRDEQRARESVIAVVGTRAAVDEYAELRTRIAGGVRAAFGFSLDEVVVVPARTIPRTTSGKRQRLMVREAYRAGSLV